MRTAYDSLGLAAVVWLVTALALIAVLVFATHADATAIAGLVLRVLHVFLAAVWIGFIVFINMIHIPAIEGADDAGRAAIVKGYLPKIAASFAHLAHGTLFTGLLLLVPTGYALSTLAYGTTVYVPPMRMAILVLGALGGAAMWAIVQFVVTPKLRLIANPASPPAARTEARATVKTYARLNLALLLPVLMAMITAAHVL